MDLGLRSISDIVRDLSKPVAVRHLATRKQGGKEILYISWATAAMYLDYYAFGWSYEIRSIVWTEDKMIVTVRISIPCLEGVVFREATGQEDLQGVNYGDSSSNAESMAFRRAAAKFGLCAYLYSLSQNEEQALLNRQQIERKPPVAIKADDLLPDQPEPASLENQPASQAEVFSDEHEPTEEELERLAIEEEARGSMPVREGNKASPAQCRMLRSMVERKKLDLYELVAEASGGEADEPEGLLMKEMITLIDEVKKR